MREILFRGKRKDNGEWVEGGIYHNSEDEIVFIIKDTGLGYHEFIEVIPETVGQFTGLYDKNGKTIFEGDILKQKTTSEFAKVSSFEWECYGIVRFGYYDWNEGEAGYASIGWYIEPLKSVSINPKNYLEENIQAGLNQYDILNKYYPMEVIGNIHDNPELLEGEKE
jgi:uncharacterized phage protein (TIGR01671 family)